MAMLDRVVTPWDGSGESVSRVQSAFRIGTSPSLFDEMVADGRMPKPKKVNTRKIWDCLQIDEAFAALPSEDDENPWDEVA